MFLHLPSSLLPETEPLSDSGNSLCSVHVVGWGSTNPGHQIGHVVQAWPIKIFYFPDHSDWFGDGCVSQTKLMTVSLRIFAGAIAGKVLFRRGCNLQSYPRSCWFTSATAKSESV